MPEISEWSDEELTAKFDEAQAVIEAAQQAQAVIDRERRRRVLAAQIAAKKAELRELMIVADTETGKLEAVLGEPDEEGDGG
jgi:hypothetical protein